MPDYRYAMKDCQVEDRRALDAFRAKRARWLDWLSEDEHHAISLSISSLVWNDAAFRTLVRAGEINEGGALGNSLLAETLIDGHFAVQTLAIRRLMDRTGGTISLTNLLKDIASHADLLTRENFVAYDGLPYDDTAARDRVLGALPIGNGPFWAAKHGPDAWHVAKSAHEMFDRLSGVNPANRQRQDRIPKRHVATLQRWLEESEADSIVQWTHKFLAHAADGHRRGQVDLAFIQPTLDRISQVSRVFARVSETLLAYLLYDSSHGVVMPVAQYDKFEHLDQPVIRAEQRPELASRWDAMEGDCNGYLQNVLEELLQGQRQTT
jgi:hypothetical protein